jgi:Flp pilus assembly protein TadD
MIGARHCFAIAALGCLLAAACASQNQEGRLNGDPFVARKRLATELAVRRELDGALAYLEPLLRERPGDVDLLVLRGVILREKGMFDQAEVDLKAAITQEPKRVDAHAAIGLVYDLRRDGEPAERHHREAVRLSPEDPSLLNNLGFCLFLRGKTREAVPVLQQAVQKQPSNRRARTNLGFALAAAGDLPRAAREFELGGTPAEARNNLGYAYERQGRLAQAFDLYVEAVRIEPRSEVARANLEHVARSMGKGVPADLPPRPDARPALHKTAAVTPAIATPATPPDASPNPPESP